MKKITLLLAMASFFFGYTQTTDTVTFQLDMSMYSGTFTTPEVNGTFNGWCGNCNAMSDPDGDNIWSVTLPLTDDTIIYKFSFDTWTGQENLTAGSSCTWTAGGFTNRYLIITGDTVLPPVCWEACDTCGAVAPLDTVDVTFQLDMSMYSGTFTTPEVNGSFNGWCGSCNAMSDPDGDNIWEITLPLVEGQIEYKFSYDNWSGQENLTSGTFCTTTNGGFTNRLLIFANDTVLPPVCWEECDTCGAAPTTSNVTFQVDMNQYTGSFTTPEVNGTFNGWCGSCNAMSDTNGDGIWEVTLPLGNDTIEYKFSFDTWTGQESLTQGTSCTTTNGGFTNRYLIITGDTVLPAVCWESCAPCVLDTFDVTFQVDMNQYTGTFTTPEVNGTFNGWCGSCNAMSDTNGDDIWEVTLPIVAGSIEYKFAHDNWTGQENLTQGAICTTTNGSGFTNRFLNITSDTILPPVCWESCDTCGAAPPDTFNVTFMVDMSHYTGSFTTPEVNGTFNGWCGSCNAMADPDGDDIWEITLPIVEGSIEYKFAYDNWAGDESLSPGLSCVTTNGGFTNRYLMITADTVLPAVCWESCNPCFGTPGVPDVTFRLDMSTFTGTYTTPEVNGTFNGWCGNCAPMADPDGDDIWELTVPLTDDSIEYKFSYDNWTGQESLTPGSPCTKTSGNFTNRFLVITNDTVLPAVCWNSCIECGGTPVSADVTFRVDLSEHTGSWSGVYLNGNFNSWCGSCAPMTSPNNDSIYEITVNVPTDTIEYKFTLDGWTVQENLTQGDPCILTTTDNTGTFHNRYLVPSNDTILPAVCWESCDECGAIGIEEDWINGLSIAPNPTQGVFEIKGQLNTSSEVSIQIYDAMGRVVLERNLQTNLLNERVDLSERDRGMYLIVIRSEEGLISNRIVLN